MIPRIEQKAELKLENYSLAIDWLKSNNFNILYPERIVSSIYFDNDKLQSYFDTVEGNTPRRKIRIRSYGKKAFDDLSNQFNIETKFSGEFYRSKTQRQIIDITEHLEHGIIDGQYGVCMPKVKITYNREYFLFKDWRVTIDRFIKYEHLRDFSATSEDQSCVLEIKTSINQNHSELRNFFEFPRSKFSKYERAVDAFI
tara:strand:- start:77 stop:673 length:597 start_codon:yes stop_codon:yes gene_type:complete